MSRIFISHSSKDNFAAVALGDWLKEQGWDDAFLDLDSTHGIQPGERWERALYNQAADCEAVLYLVSRNWLASEWCRREYELARKLNKRIFVVLIENIVIDDLPVFLRETNQAVSLAAGEDHRVFHPKMPVTHEQGHVTFSSEGLSRLKNGLTLAGLDPRFFAWPPEQEPDRAPYRGLEPMEGVDAGVFFGRDGPIIEALDALRGLREATCPRLFVILGASGAGKSSFLRAGLLPRLARDDRNFFTLPPIRPERAALSGANGFISALADAAVRQGVGITRAQIRDAAAQGAEALRPILQTLVARDGAEKPPTLVVTIDQAEELFRAEGLVEGESFLTLLRDLATQDAPAIIAVFAIRSDSYDALEHTKPLEGLGQKAFPLLPMPRGAFQTVIEGPAKRLAQAGRNFEIDPGLTQALLEDIEKGGGSDALPLLSFTLQQLFRDHGAAKRLSRENYIAFGGLKGALEAALARVFVEADKDSRIPRDHEARLALLRRGLIPWLAGVDPETKTLRRRVARAEQIPEEARPLVDLLVEQRLLTRDIDEKTGEATIEPAHEALLRQWGGLKGWLEEDFGHLAALEGVKRAARDWDANARGKSWAAHGGARLEEAGRLDARLDLAEMLDSTDRAYLAACRDKESAAREAEQARLRAEASNARNVRRVAWISTVGAAVALILAGLAGWQGWLAHQSAEKANQAKAATQVTESLLLAQQSREQAQAGLPLAAVQLALRGLPNEKDRPLVAETSGSLLEALGERYERHILSGHESSVSSVVFSPDGRLVLSTSGETTARLWNAATGKESVVLRGHDYEILSAVFSPDGARVVTASRDNTARVWDVATGKELMILRGHEYEVVSAVFSADGTRIVTASLDGTARLFDAANGKELIIIDGDSEQRSPLPSVPSISANGRSVHAHAFTSAIFSPDGRLVLTASHDNTARLWDAVTGKELVVLRGHRAAVIASVFSPDGARVMTASWDRTARLWDVATGKELAVLNGHGVLSIVFSPTGGRVVTDDWDKGIKLWDITTGQELAVLRGYTNGANSAVLSPDGGRVLTASSDKTARLWDAATGQPLAVLRGHEGYVNLAVFSPDGRRVATGAADKTARLWDIATGKESVVLRGHDQVASSATFSPDGKHVATGSEDKTARLWDAMTGKEIAVLRGYIRPLSWEEASIPSAVFSPDGGRIVTSQQGYARVWDVATGKKLTTMIGHEGYVNSAVFSPDGLRVLTKAGDNTARLWDASTGKSLLILRANQAFFGSASFSPDGSQILTACYDKTAQLWDVATGKELVVLRGHDSRVLSAVFSPDGSRVLTASDDKTARLWDAATGKELTALRGHNGSIVSALFSSDGSHVLTASTDNTARLWDALTGRELAVLRGHEGSLQSAVFSPDGSRVLTTSDDKTARLWDAATGNELGVLRGHEGGINSALFSPDGVRVVIASNDNTARIIWIGHSMEEAIGFARNTLPRELTPVEERKFFLTAE